MTAATEGGVIVGGGIAGLTAAIALARAGIPANVYEAAQAFEPIGAGIWMAPNAMQLFSRLGIARRIEEAGVPVERVAIVDQRLRRIASVDQQDVRRRFGFGIVAIQRAQLHRILMEAMGTSSVRFGKRLRSVLDYGAPPSVAFEDGSSAGGPFVIAADGIHSAARDLVMGASPLRGTGQMCWRGLADVDLPPLFQRATIEIWGRDSRMGIADVGSRKAYWFLVCGSWRGESPADIVRGYPAIAAEVLSATPPGSTNQIELRDLPARRPWSKGSVCLIGDAAHPMTPNMGQGGAQAVEDAWVIARCLSEHADPAAAFTAFEMRRFSRVRSIVNASRRLGAFIHAGWPRVRNVAFRAAPVRVASRMMNEIYDVASLLE
ncbi:MAG: FAD-dependent monooxygenase [Vicinamibacterales bacterium]